MITKRDIKLLISEIIKESSNDTAKTNHFHVIKGTGQDIIDTAYKVFLGDIWFANAVPVNEEWDRDHAGKWWLNRHTGAFDMNYPSFQKYYDDVQGLLDDLERWYISKNK